MVASVVAAPEKTAKVVPLTPIEAARELSLLTGEAVYITSLTVKTNIQTVKFSNVLLQMPEAVRQALESSRSYKSIHSLERYPLLKSARNVLSAYRQKIQESCKLEAAGNGIWLLWESYKDQYLEMYGQWEDKADEQRQILVEGLGDGYADYRQEVLTILLSTGITAEQAEAVWSSQYDEFYEAGDFDDGFYVSLMTPRLLAVNPDASDAEKRAARAEVRTIQKEKTFSFEKEVQNLQADLQEFNEKGNQKESSIETRLAKYDDLTNRIATCRTVLGLQTEELTNALETMKQNMQEQLDGKIASSAPTSEVASTKTKRTPKTASKKESAPEPKASEEDIDPGF